MWACVEAALNNALMSLIVVLIVVLMMMMLLDVVVAAIWATVVVVMNSHIVVDAAMTIVAKFDDVEWMVLAVVEVVMLELMLLGECSPCRITMK